MAGSVSGLVTFGTQVGPIATSTLDTNFTALTTAVNSANTYSNYLTDSGSANNIVVSVPSPSTATLAAGLTLTIKVAQTNTGPTTLNLNGGGAVGVIDAFGNTLSSNELVGGSIFTFVYNGSKWQIVGGSGAGGSLSTSYADTFTCTAGQTSFTLSANPNGINNLTVSLDGAVLVANIDYTWTGGTTLTLTTGAKVGQTLFVRYLEGFVVANVTATTVTYTEGGTGAVSRTVASKLQESVSVLDFGADPTGITDSTTAIQNAINAVKTAGGRVYLPVGNYKTSSPILLYTNVSIYGDGINTTFITKTTNTVGTTGSIAAPARSGVNDNYNVDAIISIVHPVSDYAYYASIKGLYLSGGASSPNTYGIYWPRSSQCTFADLYINNVTYGTYANDAWMNTLDRVTIGVCNSGFGWYDDGSGLGTGTSDVFKDCWVSGAAVSGGNAAFGYHLANLSYSALIGCGCDNLNSAKSTTGGYCYYVNSAHDISMSGCGAEASCGSFIYAANSQLAVNAFNAYAPSGATFGTTFGTLYFDSSRVTLSNVDFFQTATATPGNVYNQVIQNGSTVVAFNCTLPTGGNTFVGYGSGSTLEMHGGTLNGSTASTFQLNSSAGQSTLPAKFNGSVSATAATPITIYTLTTAGVYYVYVYVSASGTNYRSVYLVTTDGTTADATSLKAGSSLTVSLSGLAIQVTSAATAGVTYSIMQQA